MPIGDICKVGNPVKETGTTEKSRLGLGKWLSG